MKFVDFTKESDNISAEINAFVDKANSKYDGLCSRLIADRANDIKEGDILNIKSGGEIVSGDIPSPMYPHAKVEDVSIVSFPKTDGSGVAHSICAKVSWLTKTKRLTRSESIIIIASDDRKAFEYSILV